MKRKGAQFKIISFLITLVILCSFPFSCLAADYDYKEIWGYNDTYLTFKYINQLRAAFTRELPNSVANHCKRQCGIRLIGSTVQKPYQGETN